MLYANLLAQTISEIKHGILKLMVGARAPMYHLPGNIIYMTVGLVYINLQPEYELRSSTLLGQFQKFEKIELGALSPSAAAKGSFCTGSEFLFIATSMPDVTFRAPLTSEI